MPTDDGRLPRGADVVVIGGGIGGVSVGAELAGEASVIVLERESQLATHATGRSAATYVASYGPPVVRRLTAASRADFDALSADCGIPLLTPRPTVWIADEARAPALRRFCAERAGEHRLDTVSGAEIRRLVPWLGNPVVEAAVDEGTFDVDVQALHDCYVRRLRACGGRVLTAARVSAVSGGPGAWTVATPAGTLTAGALVDAAGAWADEVAGLAGVPRIGLEPRRRSLFLSPPARPLGDRSWFVIAADETFYVKNEGDHALASPADATPMAPCDARPDELEIARAIEDINAVTRLGLRSVRSAWAGLRSFVRDGGPVAGAWAGHPGFAWCAAQGGYGLQMAPALARCAARLARDQPLPEDVAAAGVTGPELRPERLGAAV